MTRAAKIFWFVCCYFVLLASAEKDCTDLARDEETLLVFSTLGGGLTAIDPLTAEIRWTIEDEPTIKAATKSDHPLANYLPDPRDGSLYQLGDMGHLTKLPYTIPQLVASAPCRSSDGILYSGKKSDTWFLIDPKTGRREKVMGFESMEGARRKDDSIGWATSRAVYLGRTQYTVIMYDSLAKTENTKPWNITFYDYASHTMAPEISSDYEYIHLAGSSTGLVTTLDRKNGKFIWQLDLSSPVVAVFLLASEGLLSVPFTTVSDNTLRNIIEDAKEGTTTNVELFRSLYIGEHIFGLYAIPSLIDKGTATISAEPAVKLIEGPERLLEDPNQNLVYLNDLLKRQKDAIVLGHYQLPRNDDNFKITILPTAAKSDDKQLATMHELDFLSRKNSFILIDGIQKHSIGIQTDDNDVIDSTSPNISDNVKMFESKTKTILSKFLSDSRAWFSDPHSGLMNPVLLVLILIVTCMFWYTYSMVRELRQHSQNGSQTSNRSSGTSNGDYHDLIDVGNGEVRVGKIQFNSNEILGKGCEGTFVFRGQFEKRNVAVKRVLPECFTFADREVALLRESDAHENVVRYFCTEQDRQFRYIAVELCAATLQDYTEGELSEKLQSQINVFEVLKQATSGLVHLHSLNIVHRDIKPQNVLISLPDSNKCVRAMISDFGLCKKLNLGRASFSRRSGITGTDGWIAPEMIKGQRTTTSVDIFSLGCVFYYVLTGGHHAFGDTLKRQANILANDYDLSKLIVNDSESANILSEQLVSDMINFDFQNRPSARAVYDHPLFWNDSKILSFFQDVSDRIEKLTFYDEPLRTLEKNAKFVVKGDWNLQLDAIITADLRKYRGYTGTSVRDLLRAFRNKKHHYHELPIEAQMILGHIPHEFTRYWIRKFPDLLSHVYHAFSICSHEAQFKSYYPGKYNFSRPNYFYSEDDDIEIPEYVKPPRIDSPKKNQKYKKNSIHTIRNRQTILDYDHTNSNRVSDDNVHTPTKFHNKRQRSNNDVKVKNVTWQISKNDKTEWA